MENLQTFTTLNLHDSERALLAYENLSGLSDDERTLLAEYFPSVPARIIDLGVGNGRTTVPLHHQGFDIVGIEFCAKLVEIANAHFPDVQIQQGDARSLQFSDSSFDAALFSWNGIDYMYPVSERIQVLREVLRVVRPGGCFIYSSHNATGCFGRLFKPTLLTKRALRFWLDQIRNLRQVMNGYYLWRDDALGMPLFYSARPSVQKKLLHACGWETLSIRSAERPSQPASTLRDVHIHYICRKPI